MNEILKEILYVLVSVCGTAVATFLCALLKKKVSELSAKIKNDKIESYINIATSTVTDAVLEVSQTYVDTLKKNGEFTQEAQVAAKNKAFTLAQKLINEDVRSGISSIYGDFAIWLNTQIEAQVKSAK